MKKILSIFLSISMIMGGAIFMYAQDGNLTVTKIFQTSSKYDLGIDAQNVRLAWQLDSTSRGAKQTAYHVQVRSDQSIVWDSGWVVSDEQTGIKTQNLQPETVYYAKVNIKDQNGIESGFSQEMSFETVPQSIDGTWIGTGSKTLRKTFTLSQSLQNVDRARAYIGSTSAVETRLNGSKVGDFILAPTRCVPDVTAYYNTFDILQYLQAGQNTAGLMVSNIYPIGNKAVGMIKIYYKDGSTQVISTDTSWHSTSASPITKENIQSGEDYNPNLLVGWDTNAFVEDSSWTNAVNADYPILVQNGNLIVSKDGGSLYTNQSFNGNYTVELGVKITQGAFGLIFGSGSPNPPMWQFNCGTTPGKLRKHMPGQWSDVREVSNADIKVNTALALKLEVTGTTVKTYINNNLIDTETLSAGQTTGQIGFRAVATEAFDADYIKVTQNGTEIFRDDFNNVDTVKWALPNKPSLAPAVTAAKIFEEIKPVSIKEISSVVDTTKPYTSVGKLIVPANSGTYYTNQTFSGDYSIEVRAEIKHNVFALLFGDKSNDRPAMWQLDVPGGGNLKLHEQGTWAVPGSNVIHDSRIQYDTMLTMKVDITGTTVKTYLEGDLKDTHQFTQAQTTGPLGIRSAPDEAFNIDYIKVTQNGNVIWEDNFDRLDTTKWNFPSQSVKYVADFGKNMSGYIRLNAQGTKDSSVKIKYAELLNSDGSIFPNTTFHRPECNYTLTGGNDVFEPKFFYTGFRYAEISGFTGALTADNLTACFVCDDVDITGDFSSSNQRLDSVFDMYKQSQLSNMVNLYIDCPQREKNGWTGDASVSKESGAILLNDYNSAEAYMNLLNEGVCQNGQPVVVPPMSITPPFGRNETTIDPTWTSAYFVFPYQTYMQTGDKYYLNKAYDGLVKIFNFYKTLDTDNDNIVTNNTFGDWVGYDREYALLDDGYLSASWVYYSGVLLSKISQELGKDHGALDGYLQNMYNAIQTKYNKGTYMATNTQTQNSMSLVFDLVPGAQKQTVINSLINNVKGYNTTLRTGVLGTKAIYGALSEANQHKLLLDMTINPNKNSFGYMLDNGATTLWEYWDTATNTWQKNNPPADTLPGAWDSQNHVMLGGGPATWMFKGLGGIQQTKAAYKEITFRAGVESGLGFVDSEIDTIIGEVVSDWTNSNGQFTWNISVPANATAKIVIPFKQVTAITESGADIFEKNGSGLVYSGTENGMPVYTAGSGDYSFNVSYEEPAPITPKSFVLPTLTQKFTNNSLDSGWNWRGDVQQNYISNNSFNKTNADNFASFNTAQNFGSGTKLTAKVKCTYTSAPWVSQFIGVRAEGQSIHVEGQKGLWFGFRNENILYVGTNYAEFSPVNIPFSFNTERDVEIIDSGNAIEVYAYNNGEKVLLTKVLVGTSSYDVCDGNGNLVSQKSVALNQTGTYSFVAYGSISTVRDISIGNICNVSIYKDNVEKGELLQGTMQLKINGCSNGDFFIALAVFDGSKCVSVHSLEDAEKAIEFSVPNNNCTAKIIIIDSLNSLRPIDHAVEY